MSEVIIDTASMRRYADRIGAVNSRIVGLDRRLKTLYNRVGLLGLWNLIQADILTGYSWRLSKAQSYLYQTAAEYESVENLISQLDPTSFSSPSNTQIVLSNKIKELLDGRKKILDAKDRILSYANPFSVIQGMAESMILVLSGDAWSEFWHEGLSDKESGSLFGWQSDDGKKKANFLGYEIEDKFAPEYGKYEDKDKFYKLEQEKEDIKQIGKDEKWYKEKGTIFEVEKGTTLDVSLLSGELEGKSDYAQGSIKGKVADAEAHGSSRAGFYVYDKEGNKLFSPGVSAEVGTSVSVLQGEAEGRVGLGKDNNMLGLYGEAEAEVLTAEASGDLKLNLREVHAGLKAEANIAEVSATGGVSILGTDIGVSGSLNVGIGAHADIGYTDGVFKVDIGASLGVGASVGFEVDIGGTVDAVCDCAKAVWDWLF